MINISKETHITSDHAQKISEILVRYFNSHKRNQSFQSIKDQIILKFDEFLPYFNLQNGTHFASNFFLFCYSLSKNNYIEVQNQIYSNIAVPFQRWVKKKGTNFSNLIDTIPIGEDYVFICRRATVAGLYAPGKSIYTYAEALLARGESVWIIVLWSSDEQFMSLKEKYKKLKVSVLSNAGLEVRLISVIEILKLAEPKVILTEAEFELPSVLAILNYKIPFIYLSQTFYNLPWYDSIGLMTEIDSKHEGRSKKDFFDIPVWINRNILDPQIDSNLIDKAKEELGIQKNDFVIGAFNRMEKHTEPFLDFLCELLDKEERIKILLAGPNSQNSVNTKLKRYINENRAIVLGPVNVNILGHCLDLGVDTFPLHSGYSVLELMAKKIPVIAKKDKYLGSLIKDRLPETLKSEESDLVSLVLNLINDSMLLEDYKNKTNNFISKKEKSKEFLECLDDRVNILIRAKKHEQTNLIS